MKRVVLLIAALLLCRQAAADIAVLNNGETLSGTLVRAVAGTLVFRTQLSGQMMTPLDTVKSLATEKNQVISRKDQPAVYGRFVVVEGRTMVAPLSGEAPFPVDLAEVREIMPIPAAAESGAPPAVSVGAGVRAAAGDRDRLEPELRAGAVGGGDGLDWGVGLRAAPGDDGEIPGFAEGGFFLEGAGDRWAAPYARLDFGRDADRALDFGGRLTLGLFHQFVPPADTAFAGYLGVAVARERWEDGGAVEYDTDPGLHLGLRHYARFKNSTTLTSTLSLYPSLDDVDDITARGESTLRIPLSGRLHLRLDFRLDWMNDPVFSGYRRWNASTSAAVGVDF